MRWFRLAALKAAIMVLILMSTLGATSVKASIQAYRLVSSTEYMDNTYTFTLDPQGQLKVICGEYAAPTFDPKYGLIDWVDLYEQDLELVYGQEIAGKIRAIISVAGPHIKESWLVTYFSERLGIEEVTYEEIMSACQYAIWYYTDQVTKVPTSENGEDVYKYLIALTGVTQPAEDEITLRGPKIESNENELVVTFSYHTQGPSRLEEMYSIDPMIYGGLKRSKAITNGQEVTWTFPKSSNNMKIDFTIYVDGEGLFVPKVKAYAPAVKGTLQTMVGYQVTGDHEALDHKKIEILYKRHELIIENQDHLIKGGYDQGLLLAKEWIETKSRPLKEGFDFTGWVYAANNKPVSFPLIMDGPKHIKATYKINPQEPGPGQDPNVTDQGNNSDLPGGSDPNSPDLPNPDGGEDGEADLEMDLPDDPTPEGLPDGQVGSPDQPMNPESLPDDPLPESNPELKGNLKVNDLSGHGPIRYYFNRLAKSGGIPFIIFMLFGLSALALGAYIRRGQAEKDNQNLILNKDQNPYQNHDLYPYSNSPRSQETDNNNPFV